MSRFIPQADMTPDQLVQCSHQATAIIALCESAARSIQNGGAADLLADSIGSALRLTFELMEPVHDALERHEGVKGGARGASPRLSEMLSEHERVTAGINQHEDHDGPDVVALCKQQRDNALAIIGHRPVSRADERRKAEFLRDWTDSTYLTEEEQTALIASLMPEGGEA